MNQDSGWDESNRKPYFTDKPDWIGWGSVQFAAACVDLLCLLPERVTATDLGNIALADVFAPNRVAAYPQILVPTLWVPFPGSCVTVLPHPLTGERVHVGSSLALLQELNELNEETYGIVPGSVDAPKAAGDGSYKLMDTVTFGLSIMLRIVGLAVEHNLPVVLDA